MKGAYTHSVRMDRQLAADFKRVVAARGLKLGWATEEAVRQWLERERRETERILTILGPSSGAAVAAGGSGLAAGSGAPESVPPARCVMPDVAENVAVPTMRHTGRAAAEQGSGESIETSSCG